MPIAAGVVRDQRMAARRVLAACDVPAERRRAAMLDRSHHLRLVKAQMPAVGLTPSSAVIAEDVRDLQSRSSHGGAKAPAALRCLVSHACGAACLGHRAGSRLPRSEGCSIARSRLSSAKANNFNANSLRSDIVHVPPLDAVACWQATPLEELVRHLVRFPQVVQRVHRLSVRPPMPSKERDGT